MINVAKSQLDYWSRNNLDVAYIIKNRFSQKSMKLLSVMKPTKINVDTETVAFEQDFLYEL